VYFNCFLDIHTDPLLYLDYIIYILMLCDISSLVMLIECYNIYSIIIKYIDPLNNNKIYYYA
jgi:hypothetical protein